MNTLTDLRQTLGEQAERVTDQDAIVRTTAVRHRVAVVRRRRRAVGAGALALVVGATVGFFGLQRASSDPAPVLLGVQAPDTMTSLTYTYAADGWSDVVTGHGSVKVGASGRPRLISWTLQGATSVRLVLPNGEIWHSRASRFRDFVALPAGQSGTLSVAAGHGEVGLATYALTDQAPPGYTKDGVTFRQTAAGAPLLGAVIGDRGQTDVTTSYVAPQGTVGLSVSCVGLPQGDVVHVDFNGSQRSLGDCTSTSTFDPGGSVGYEFTVPQPGQPVAMRVWASSDARSVSPLAAGSAPDLRMFAAVYGPERLRSVVGSTLDAVMEHDGHTWHLASTSTSADGGPIDRGPFRQQMLGAMAWHTVGATHVSFAAQGMRVAGTQTNGGPAALPGLWVPEGASVQVRLLEGTGKLGVAFYRRVD